MHTEVKLLLINEIDANRKYVPSNNGIIFFLFQLQRSAVYCRCQFDSFANNSHRLTFRSEYERIILEMVSLSLNYSIILSISVDIPNE